MQYQILFAGLIAPVLAIAAPQEPAPPGDDPGGDLNNIQATAVKVGGTRVNWGVTFPWDALSMLHSVNGGPCDENGCAGSIDVPSQYVINFDDPAEFTITISAEGHYIGSDVQDALVGAAVQAINPATVTENAYYGPDQTSTFPFRMAPDTLSITLNDAEGDQKGDMTITVHPNLPEGGPPPPAGICSTFSTIASGISAALSVGAPVFAVPAGIFGIISATCE